MNVTARRAVSVVAAGVLVAAVAMATATPAFAKKPDGNDKPDDTAFTIKTNLDGYEAFWGTFRAQGAIEDLGDATYHLWGYNVLDVSGKHGSMLIATFITHGDGNRAYGTFWIFSADGAYSGLIDVMGTYTERIPNYKPVWVYPEGPFPTWHLYQTLEGSLPE